MTAGTTAVSVFGGFVVFGDPLGRTAPLVVLHLVAFALVAVAAAILAPAASGTGGHPVGHAALDARGAARPGSRGPG
jgi:hypothetical protein